MRVYEEMFIVRPDATEEEIDPLVEQMKSVITTQGGTVDKVEKMGVRKLAYRVQKKAEGYYVLIQFTSEAQIVKELERRLRVSDMVMKFITVRIDEKLKRAAKLKKQKEARAQRKPQIAPPAPSPEQVMAEAAARESAAAPGLPVPEGEK